MQSSFTGSDIQMSPKAHAVFNCIHEVQQQAELELTGENTQGGRYKYATHADIMKTIRPILKKHACIVTFSVTDISVDSGYQKLQGAKDAAPKDKLVTSTLVALEVRLIHSVEDWIAVTSFGFKVDSVSDKALGAQTIATRYALLALFGLPSSGEEDPDNNKGDVRRLDNTGLFAAPAPAAPVPSASGTIFGGLF